VTNQPDLHERLRQARAREGLEIGPNGQKGLPTGPWGIGLRAGVEVVSALAVGIGIGWLLDRSALGLGSSLCFSSWAASPGC
jgi:ATP synthase protein I